MKQREVNLIEVQVGPSGFWPWVIELFRWIGFFTLVIILFWTVILVGIGLLARLLG